MADSQLYTNQAAIAKGNVVKTTLALSKLRLFQSGFTPNRFTTKDELVAQECTFDGYVSGGYTLTAWTGATQDPNGGGVITSPLVNPTYGPAEDPPVGNECGGGWVELAAGTVWLVFIFNPARPLQVVGDGFPIVLQIVEARNPIVVTE